MRMIDAHFHIWRQADLPWLVGPMQPRIFGPYEAIRRDYPMSEYRAEASAAGVEKAVYVQANWPVDRAEAEVAWVETVAHETGWPHAIVGYADMTGCRRPAGPGPPRALSQECAVSASSSTGTKTLSTASPPIPTCAAHLLSRPMSPDWPTMAGRSTCRFLPSQMPGAAELARACPQVPFILQHAGMLTDTSPAASGRMARRHRHPGQ